MRRLASALVVLGSTALSGVAVAAEGNCIADWSEAAQIVQTEKLTTVEKLTAAARTNLKGEILKTTLCVEKGDFVYRLVVRGTDGKLKSVTVNARTPFAEAAP